MEWLTPEACYRALQARDPRFDGRVFVGVRSTGIYCRPVCPARTPQFKNCRFFPSAAAAQEAGFRPCLRCRPETAPQHPCWRGTSNTVSRALTLIESGALDHAASVEDLAERVGVGERQLRRLFEQHLGASPLAVAQTRRVLLAKQLLHETQMPVTQIALASGFGSVRRFNECFQKLFNRPPISLRRRRGEPEQQGRITLLLRYRPPYDWNAMLSFLGARAIPGVECLGDRTYLRTFAANGSAALIAIANVPGQSSLRITLDFPNSPAMRSLPDAVARVRRVFDLGADVTTISDHLSRDPRLAPLVASHPGLRVPGGWDPFELAVRAVLGQQISVEAARNLTGRLVALCGTEVTTWHTLNQNLNRLFPTAEQVAAADLSLIGMPGTRRTTLRALAVRIHERPAILEGFGSLEEALTRLRDIPGIGPWTAEYIALRALREPDAFPASDLGLLRSAGELSGTRPTAADLLRQAEDWRPWRAYAAQHLWTSEAAHE